MINIYICEDNKAQLGEYRRMIKDYLSFHGEELYEKFAYAALSPGELLKHLNDNPPGLSLYFLDINLRDEIDGLQLAQKIREKDPIGCIVFITSKSEMSFQILKYHVEALDYIIKDNTEDIEKQIQDCMEKASRKYKNAKTPEGGLLIKTRDETVYINPYEILYLETSNEKNHAVILHMANEMQTTHIALKKFEDLLKKYPDFFRCHNSYVVNFKFFQAYNPKAKAIVLQSGIMVPVSDRHQRELKQRIAKLPESNFQAEK